MLHEIKNNIITAIINDLGAELISLKFNNIDVLNDLNKAKNITLFADVQMPASAADTHYNLLQSLVSGDITPADFTKQTEESLKSAK